MTKTNRNSTPLLWAITGILFLAFIFSRALFPEYVWLSAVVAVLLLASLAGLIKENHRALRSRSVAYGVNSVVTILLVIGIVGVVDFLSSKYPYKVDLTKNKIHTLSDQTVKVVKGLKSPVKATVFIRSEQRDQFRTLLDSYHALNPKFEIEYVVPEKEPTRAKAAGVKKYGTLVLTVGTRENKVDDITEEKLTNAIIKLNKEKEPIFCTITGHGEKNFNGSESEGYSSVKKALTDQSYEVKDVNLAQDPKGLENCTAIGIIGPTKDFFGPETKLIQDYFGQGGRGIIAVDLNLKGAEYAPSVDALLESWHLKPQMAMIVDPTFIRMGADATVPLILPMMYGKDNPISKDFSATSAFPFARPLEIVPGAPTGMSVQWLAKTTERSFGVTDMKELAKGEVQFRPDKDLKGPFIVAAAVEGKQKDSKAPKATRLVVLGTSAFATNVFTRQGGNLDFFVNSVSWVMEDESLISIRTKEEGTGRVELTQKSGYFIFLLTVFVIPALIAVSGIVIWVRRRGL